MATDISTIAKKFSQMVAAALAGAVAALFDVGLQVGRGCEECRRQSKCKRGSQRQKQREHQDRASDVNRTDLDHIGRKPRLETPDSADREKHTGNSPEQPQQTTLGQ